MAAMSALTRYFVNTVQAKTGLGNEVIVGYVLQAVFALVTAVLFLVAVFFVFAEYFAFGNVATAIGMFLVFAAMLVGSMIYTNNAKQRTKDDAQRALRVPAGAFLSPPLLKVGLQLGRQFGWRRILPAAVVTLATTGVAAEWIRRHHADGHDD